MLFGGPHLHLDQNTHVIQQGGDDGGLDDDSVLHPQGLGHDEGGGAHNGGQQLAAHRGGGLNGAGKLLGVACLFHQGDGEGAGGDHVGHSGAVDGAQEAGGQHGHLSRAALGVTGQGVGDVVEELAHAALVHHFAEDDKQDDIGGGHLDGGAVDAVDIGGEIGDDAVPVIAPVHEETGHIPAEYGIDQEDDGQDAQGRTAESAGALQHQQDQDRTEDNVNGLALEAGGDEYGIADEYIDGHDRRQSEADPVVPYDFFPAGLFKGGVEQEADHQHQSHMDGVVLDVHHL